MSNLMLHCGSQRVSREQLKSVLTPTGTSSWHPVSHYDIASMVNEQAIDVGYDVVSEEYGLSPNHTKMFGLLKFEKADNPEWSRCLGFRNSHDRSIALGITVGLSVCVCDNMVFGGELTIQRRHTKGICIEELIPEAFANLDVQYTQLEEDVERLKANKVNINQARIICVKAAEIRAIRPSDVLTVLNEWKHPRHEEFSHNNQWSLYNSFNEVAKKYSPQKSDQCYRGLGMLFELNGKVA